MPTLLVFDQEYGPYAPGVLAGFSHEEAVRITNLKAGPEKRPVAHLATQAEIQAKSEAPQPNAPAELVSVRIVGPNVNGYSPGDVAGFDATTAQRLIDDRHALPNPPTPAPTPRAAVRRSPKTGEKKAPIKK